MSRISAFLDSAIATISPKAAYNRARYRRRLAWAKALEENAGGPGGGNRGRSDLYAAAKESRLTGGWMPVESNINTIIGGSKATVTARMRQLVRDMPHFSRAVQASVDYTVGNGIIFQSRIRKRGNDDKFDKKRIQQVEDAFNFWAEKADIAGRMHYYEMMQLSKRQDLETGEFVAVKTLSKNRNRYIPFALQMYEADWITSNKVQAASPQNTIEQGIEYVSKTGEVVAYHFDDPDSWGKSQRILAENVIHKFQVLRPGQIRGITPWAAGILLARDLQDIMEAEIDTVKMASKYLALVTAMDPEFAQRSRNVKNDPDSPKKIEELENAIIDYLRPGEDVKIVHNPRPGTNFPPFIRLLLTMFSIVTGVPYEIVTGDYRGLNFATGKMIRTDYAHALRPIVGRHIRAFCTETIIPFMHWAVMAGKLDFPDFFQNPFHYLRSQWQPPGMDPVDMLRESKAHIDDIKAGLRSPQEVVLSRGRDLESVYKEIKRAKELAQEVGISFEDVSTALANNPEAVTKQKGVDDKLLEIADALEEMASQSIIQEI